MDGWMDGWMDRDEGIKQRFAKIGLHVISPQWLLSCREYLKHENTTNNILNNNGNSYIVQQGQNKEDDDDDDDDDEILFQILNTDLRNVIRPLSTSKDSEISNTSRTGATGTTSTSSNSSYFPSKILRRAIQNSSPASTTTSNNSSSSSSSSSSSQTCVVVLPASFQLLLQVEELLDVSLNAEDRLTLGPASLSSPTPVGNQKNRCLKMFLSDGYFGNGDYDCCNDDVEFNVNTSISTPATTEAAKTATTTATAVIVAMETEPIPDLSVHSKPGIKILLTGPIELRFGILMLHAGNTTVLGGCIPALIPIQKKAMDMAAKLSGVGIDPTFRALVWNPEAGMEQEEQDEGEGESGDLPPPPLPPPSVAVVVPVVAPLGGATSSSRSTISGNDASSRPSVVATTGTGATATAPSPLPLSTSMSLENPYKRNNQFPPANANAPARSTSIPTTSTNTGINGTTPTMTAPAMTTPVLTTTTNTATTTSRTTTATRTTPTTRISLDPSMRQHMSPTALSEPMSFGELGTVLKRIIGKSEEYRQYEGKIFIVACKYAPPQKKCKKFKGFDIQKRKDYKKLGLDKYEFAMTCQLMGSNESMGKITCKINHDVLKHYFSTSAGELRTMIRENKEQANKIANEGGTNVLSDLKPLSNCYMRLIYSCEEFFNNRNIREIDGENALLELFQREDLMI